MKKPIVLSEAQRQFLIYQIKKRASTDLEYQKHVEDFLLAKKQELEKKNIKIDDSDAG